MDLREIHIHRSTVFRRARRFPNWNLSSIISSEEAALSGMSSGEVWAYKNVGDASAPVWDRQSMWDPPDQGSFSAPSLADLDADGEEPQDLLVGHGFRWQSREVH